MKEKRLSGKTALVTGGGGVLGGVFARALAAQGARVAVLNRSLSSGEVVAEQIRVAGGQALALAASVTDKQALTVAREELEAVWGSADILVNAAGGAVKGDETAEEIFEPVSGARPSFFDMDPERYRTAVDLNLYGTFLSSQVFMEGMAAKGEGCVINVASMSSYAPLTKIAGYSSAKSAVANLTQWLAIYFAGSGIRVNAIAPGFFATPQNRHLQFNEDGSMKPRARRIIQGTPMGRFGDPEELAGAVVFLADQTASGFITGAVLPVDGGFRAYLGV